MATSDNVVRAGLTPKLKDAETLVEMLTYRLAPADILRGDMPQSVPLGVFERHYAVPVRDFALASVELTAPASAHDVEPLSTSPAIVLVTAGHGTVNGADARAGSAFLVPHGQRVQMQRADDADTLQCFIATTHLEEN